MLAENLSLDPSMPLGFSLIGYDWYQHRVDRSVHGHQDFDWLQTLSGSGDISIDQHVIHLQPGQAILFHPQVPHAYHPTEAPWKTAFLAFSGTIAHQLTTELGLERYLVFDQLDDSLATFIQHEFQTFATDTPEKRIAQSTAVYRFLLLLRQNNQNSNRFYIRAIFEPIIGYIAKHYSESITNADLSEITGYSTTYQTKLFKDYYGITPLQYLTQFRISKAKALLMSHDDLQIQDIAYDAGFTDISHFIQAFKNDTGYTPLKYRNCHQFG